MYASDFISILTFLYDNFITVLLGLMDEYTR
jgi:hypothetical protein